MSNYDAAVRAAIDRDIADAERLDHFHSEITQWLDRIIPDLHPLGHPDADWQPDQLVEALQEQLKRVAWEQTRLRGPLVIGGQ